MAQIDRHRGVRPQDAVELVEAHGETDDQLFVWLPDQKVLLPGDNLYHAFPNLYTIRGTKPRPVDAWIDSHFDEQVRFLQALIQVPTDTPPGNNAPHAERAADDAPVAQDDIFLMNEDALLNATVTINDNDIDDIPAQLSWTIVNGGTAAANGLLSMSSDGNFSYAPAQNFSGTVAFTYTVCDPGGACDPATVSITIEIKG